MNKITVIVATFGSAEWEDRGATLAASFSDRTDGDHPDEIAVWHEENGTLADARNKSAALTTNGWLCFLDADDQLAPGYFREMRRVIDLASDEYDVPLLVPAVQYVENGKPVGRAEIPSWHRSLIDVNCAVIGTLIPRHLFLEVGGFRDDLQSLEDWALWLRCVRAGACMVPVTRAVYMATRNEGSRNSDQSPYSDIRREQMQGFDWKNVRSYKVLS